MSITKQNLHHVIVNAGILYVQLYFAKFSLDRSRLRMQIWPDYPSLHQAMLISHKHVDGIIQ